jgi:PASTA domain
MTDQQLSDILERAGERIPSGTPPLQQMFHDADRTRRGRLTRWAAAVAVGGVVAVAAAVMGGPALLPAAAPPSSSSPSSPTPSDDLTVTLGPASRLVGIGHAAIAVPGTWATNALRCGTATENTVVVDVTAIDLCQWNAPKSYDVVWVERGVNEAMFNPVEEISIDGVAAQSSGVQCAGWSSPAVECSATVYIPSADASFRISAFKEARVKQMLTWIHVLDNVVAVPGFRDANDDHQKDDAGKHYRAELEAAGLAVEVVTQSRPGLPAGYVLDVSPQPGTMLEPGDTVTVTEVAQPSGPGEEVRVDLNSVGPGDSMDYRGRTDAQLRAGTRIELDVGSRIWVHGFGPGISTLEGELVGTSLELDEWREGPNYGHSWVAVEPGTTHVTVTITADGERVIIGTVTVAVR